MITGGAGGIGFAAAKRFAALGMRICLADLSQEALDQAAQQLSGASVVAAPTDVSKMEAAQGRSVKQRTRRQIAGLRLRERINQ